MVDRLKRALGLDLKPRVRALEVEIGRVQGWMAGADARDNMLAATLDELMGDKR